MAISTTLAICLGNFRFGESSRIVSFLTKDFGLIKCVAKGALGKRNRFGSCLEVYSRINLVFYFRPKKDLFTLSQTDLLEYYPAIRNDLARDAFSQVCAELMRKVLLPQEDEKTFYHQFEAFLESLNSGEKDSAEITLVRFLLDFCSAIGFRVNLSVVCDCGKPPNRPFLVFANGTVFCASCAGGRQGRGLSDQAYQMLKAAGENAKSGPMERKVLLEILRLIQEYLSLHLEKPLQLKSLRFLEMLGDVGNVTDKGQATD